MQDLQVGRTSIQNLSEFITYHYRNDTIVPSWVWKPNVHKLMLKKIAVSFGLCLFKNNCLQANSSTQSHFISYLTKGRKKTTFNSLWSKVLPSKSYNRTLNICRKIMGLTRSTLRVTPFLANCFLCLWTTAKSNTDRRNTSELQHFLKSFHCFKYALRNKQHLTSIVLCSLSQVTNTHN